MAKIEVNGKVYEINKEKLKFVLEKLSNKEVNENEFTDLIKKFKLDDEYFLENVNKL